MRGLIKFFIALFFQLQIVNGVETPVRPYFIPQPPLNVSMKSAAQEILNIANAVYPDYRPGAAAALMVLGVAFILPLSLAEISPEEIQNFLKLETLASTEELRRGVLTGLVLTGMFGSFLGYGISKFQSQTTRRITRAHYVQVEALKLRQRLETIGRNFETSDSADIETLRKWRAAIDHLMDQFSLLEEIGDPKYDKGIVLTDPGHENSTHGTGRHKMWGADLLRHFEIKIAKVSRIARKLERRLSPCAAELNKLAYDSLQPPDPGINRTSNPPF